MQTTSAAALFATEQLAQLMTGKREVLEQMRDLARRQLELIAQGDMSKMMHVLAAKETSLRQLLQFEKLLDPFRSQDPEARQWASPEARRRCQLVAQRCEALLAELMLLEKQGEADLRRRRDETAARLQHADTAGQARRAYAHPLPSSANQLDLSSEA